MTMTPTQAVALVQDQIFPMWRKRLETLDAIDGWLHPHQDRKMFPLSRRANNEHRALQKLSEAPWGSIVVSTVSQTLDLESIYTETANDPTVGRMWTPWKRNRMDAVQVPLHKGAIAFGEAYNRVTRDTNGLALINARSSRDAYVVYRDSRDLAEMPLYALEKDGQWDASSRMASGLLKLWDEDGNWYSFGYEAGDLTFIESGEYDYGVVPFIRYAPQIDLEGQSRGEIQPLIPLLGRIEKTAYDRLLIQHNSSWKVRTATGLDGEKFTDADKMKLSVDDILTGEEGVTFGTLPETSTDPMVNAHKADIDVLSALSQTPITALGQFINVSADAIAEARAALYAKRDDYRKVIGMSHLDTLRFAAHIEGRTEDAANFDIYAGWADTEVRTMAASAQALGTVATMLDVPVQELWPMLPFVNYTMAEKWKSAAKSADAISSMAEAVARLGGGEPTAPVTDQGPAHGNAA